MMQTRCPGRCFLQISVLTSTPLRKVNTALQSPHFSFAENGLQQLWLHLRFFLRCITGNASFSCYGLSVYPVGQADHGEADCPAQLYHGNTFLGIKIPICRNFGYVCFYSYFPFHNFLKTVKKRTLLRNPFCPSPASVPSGICNAGSRSSHFLKSECLSTASITSSCVLHLFQPLSIFHSCFFNLYFVSFRFPVFNKFI